MKLLFLHTNPDGVTRYMASKYIEEKFAKAKVTSLDLTKEFDGKYLAMNNVKSFYADSEKWINRILEHDVVVITTSMYNCFPNPASINFLNKIFVAQKTFKYAEDGKMIQILGPEFKEKKLIIIASSGSKSAQLVPSVQTTFDAYTQAFGAIGLSNSQLIYIDGTNTPDVYGKSHQEIYEHYKNKFV